MSSASGFTDLLSSSRDDLQALDARDLRRTLTTLDAIRGMRARIGRRWLTLWCTNDYLGLSRHPRVIRAATIAAARWGIGARASRLLAGSTALHRQLEQRLADFFRAEDALVFPSGYAANLGAIPVLAEPGDLILTDRLAHASLIEACRSSRAQLRVFRHQDVDQLATVLQRAPRARRRLVVTEGVFSMDGDRAPLRPLLDVVRRHRALLYLDDAHGAFVIGRTGRGSPEAAGVPHGELCYMGTLGKALGAQGGFVIGPRVVIELLRNRARSFIYSTALATPVAAAALEALRIVDADATLRARLFRHAQRLQRALRASPQPELAAAGAQEARHIVPIVVGASPRALALSWALRARGIFAPAIRPPTVPNGTARLRLSLSAAHTPRQVDQLVEALRAEL